MAGVGSSSCGVVSGGIWRREPCYRCDELLAILHLLLQLTVFSVFDMLILKLLYFSLKVAEVSLSESGHLVQYGLTSHNTNNLENTIIYATSLILAFPLSLITLPAEAEDYVAIAGGASFWNQTHNSDELEGGSEPGYMVNLALGREYGNSYRAELELSFRHNNVHGINDPDNGNKSSGDGNIIEGTGLFINGAYDFRPGKSIRPYIMAGPGVMHLKVSDDDGAKYPLDDNSTIFGFQAGFGARLNFTENLRGDIGVRQMYTDTTDLENLHTNYDTTTFTAAVGMNF